MPVLVDITRSSLRSNGNGGRVQSANGCEIVFTLGDRSTLLKHEIQTYDPITGHVVAWVLLPSLWWWTADRDGSFYRSAVMMRASSEGARCKVWYTTQ